VEWITRFHDVPHKKCMPREISEGEIRKMYSLSSFRNGMRQAGAVDGTYR